MIAALKLSTGLEIRIDPNVEPKAQIIARFLRKKVSEVLLGLVNLWSSSAMFGQDRFEPDLIPALINLDGDTQAIISVLTKMGFLEPAGNTYRVKGYDRLVPKSDPKPEPIA